MWQPTHTCMQHTHIHTHTHTHTRLFTISHIYIYIYIYIYRYVYLQLCTTCILRHHKHNHQVNKLTVISADLTDGLKSLKLYILKYKLFVFNVSLFCKFVQTLKKMFASSFWKRWLINFSWQMNHCHRIWPKASTLMSGSVTILMLHVSCY